MEREFIQLEIMEQHLDMLADDIIQFKVQILKDGLTLSVVLYRLLGLLKLLQRKNTQDKGFMEVMLVKLILELLWFQKTTT